MIEIPIEERAKIITISNSKGGVGKTTASYTLGQGLAALGNRVVQVDMDIQGNQSRSLNLLGEDGLPPDGLFYLMTVGSDLEDVLVEFPMERLANIFDSRHAPPAPTEPGSLDLLPGYKRTALIAEDIRNRGYDILRLQEKLMPLVESCDYIIFDTPPGMFPLMPSVYTMSDFLLVTTLPAQWSVDGVSDILQTRQNQVRSGYTNVSLLGVQPVAMRNGPLEHQEQLARLQTTYGDLVWQPVSQSVIWEEAAAYGESVLTWDPDSKASKEAWSFVRTFIETVGEKIHELA
jgi:chromosome partitioning protein